MDSTADILLHVCNLSVSYMPVRGAPVRAVTDLSLQVRTGEILGIFGESGSGKSTLARAILGLLPSRSASHGQVLFRDCDLLSLRDNERNAIRGRDLALIPQDPATSLNPVMRVGTQIAEVLRAHLPLPAHARRSRVKELLSEMGLDPGVYHAYPHQLSGGQRQRIVIAQALACRPALIIADEPTSKLDAALRTGIATLFSNIRAIHRTTVILITHDPTLLAGIADRVAVLYAGRVVEVARSSALFRHPLHPYTQAFARIFELSTQTLDRKQVFPILTGDPPDPTVAAHGCAFEPRCDDRLAACAQVIPSEAAPEPSRFVRCLKYDA